MLPKPCVTCGTPFTGRGAYCGQHTKQNERKRSARRNGRYGPGWPALSARVLKRDGYICQIQLEGCLGRATTADHIIPISQGGPSTMGNLQAACRPCNSRKGATL